MAFKQVQCDMCCKEQAVGYCNTCGNIGESCFGIHKIGRIFKTHILKTYEKDGYNPRCIVYDITEEICKHHPTERALLFCKIHESMICGRCFRSDHISCGHEVIDLCLEANHIDYDHLNAMSAALNDIKDDCKRTKEEAHRKKEMSYTHAVKCNKELDDLENKLKQKVNDSISGFRQDSCKLNDENIAGCSSISSICEENMSWAIKEESKLNECVNNSHTGRLYLISRKFDKGISEVKRQMKEAEYKHTLKEFCLKENTVALKCMMEDLRDVCEVKEEFDGSDEGTTNSMGSASQKTQMTRKELIEALNQAKLDVDKADTTRKGFEKESLQAKQSLATSEKTRKEVCDELKQVKQDLQHSEKARIEFELELKRTKEDMVRVERERSNLLSKFRHIGENVKWTQPTGTLEVKTSIDEGLFEKIHIIKLIFTFLDGIQTRYHTFPGKSYKGGMFTGYLANDIEGQVICRMLKASFRRGLMFTVGKDEKVVLDGVSLFKGPVPCFLEEYEEYIQTVKAGLAAKGITDQTEKLDETFTVNGP